MGFFLTETWIWILINMYRKAKPILIWLEKISHFINFVFFTWTKNTKNHLKKHVVYTRVDLWFCRFSCCELSSSGLMFINSYATFVVSRDFSGWNQKLQDINSTVFKVCSDIERFLKICNWFFFHRYIWQWH